MEHQAQPDNQRQTTIKTAKAFLATHDVMPAHLHDIVHIVLVASGLKPASFIAAEQINVESTEELMKELHLVWREKPLTPDKGGKFYDITLNPDRLKAYLEQETKDLETTNPSPRSHGLTSEWDQINGEFLGYPQATIDAFSDYAAHLPTPHPFWLAVYDGTTVSDDLALTMEATDIVPATTDDPDVMAWGAKIRSLLDEIDPTLSERFTQWGQARINQERSEYQKR
jgi:hypothetical protein